MKKAGIITGASSGIGKELARIHASNGNNVILVARRKDALDKLAIELIDEFKIEAHVFVMDLTLPNGPSDLYAYTQKQGIFIDYLFNNAGFGGHGTFANRSWESDGNMIDLNIKALTELMHLFLPSMIANKEGRILNTASTAGFIPGPLQATYFATKAYVLSLTKATSFELRNTGVTVTALCPGPVKTEFEEVAGMRNSGLFENGADPKSTAKKGYSAMMKGKRTVISSIGYTLLLRILMPIIPDRLVLRIIEKMQSM